MIEQREVDPEKMTRAVQRYTQLSDRSVRQLAAAARMSDSAIGNYMQGVRVHPRPDKIRRLAAVLGVDVEDLLRVEPR